MFALWNTVTLLRPAIDDVLKRGAGDSKGSCLGSDFEARDDTLGHLVLDTAVEPLGVLAEDDEIDVSRSASAPRRCS